MFELLPIGCVGFTQSGCPTDFTCTTLCTSAPHPHQQDSDVSCFLLWHFIGGVQVKQDLAVSSLFDKSHQVTKWCFFREICENNVFPIDSETLISYNFHLQMNPVLTQLDSTATNDCKMYIEYIEILTRLDCLSMVATDSTGMMI